MAILATMIDILKIWVSELICPNIILNWLWDSALIKIRKSHSLWSSIFQTILCVTSVKVYKKQQERIFNPNSE
jgi:hypothetical protein